jgi:hypothetical protein
MRVRIAVWFWCIASLYTGVTPAAASRDQLAELHRTARQLYDDGEYRRALEVIDQMLVIAPRDRQGLALRPSVLYALLDWGGAINAYRAYARVVAGATLREVRGIIKQLEKAHPPLLDITVANGSAVIYLDPGKRKKPPLCTAQPSCRQPVLPGLHRIIAERPGFERWTGQVAVTAATTTPIVITLVEKPSQLTVRGPAGARITIDGAAYGAPAQVPAGAHRIVVSLPGHRTEHREIIAREGTPVEIDVALERIVPVRVVPANASLLLDGKPVTREASGLVLPPGEHKLVIRAPGFADHIHLIPAVRANDYGIMVVLVRPPPPPPRFTLRRKIAVASLGAGLAAGTAGAVLGIQSGELDDDSRALCPLPAISCSEAIAANELNRRAQQRATQANIAYGAAGAAAVAAAILWFTGAPRSGVSISPQTGAGTGVAVTGRF